ncbi:hypothetical protein [Microbacterium aurugineum]
MLATTKQIDLAIRLEIRLRKLAPAHRDLREAELAKKTKTELDALIKGLNRYTGFHASTSLATPNQKKFLETLERELVGIVSHDIDTITYDEANSRIQYFRAERTRQAAAPERLAPVTDLFTRKAI